MDFNEATASKNYYPTSEPQENAIKLISPKLEKGDLVVVESTVFPGASEQIVLPLIEWIIGIEIN